MTSGQSGSNEDSLPDPEYLRRLREVDPTLADDLGAALIERVKHEQKNRDNRFEERKLGQWLGFAAVIAVLITCCVLAFFDKEIAAGIIGFGGLIGLARVFVPKVP